MSNKHAGATVITPHTQQLIDLALAEDLAGGDVTTDAIFSEHDVAEGELLAKEALVQCGSRIFDAVMHRVDPRIEITWALPDGAEVVPGTPLAQIKGPTRSILKAERVALNFLQRMCGVATHTRRFVEALVDSEAVIVDTRKTMPGYRLLDKEAVRLGGGRNHRMSLSGGVMVKDNHIAAAGSVYQAVEAVSAVAPHTLRIEVEVTELDQIEDALEAGADILLLDNMSVEKMAEAVKQVEALSEGRRVWTEASGGITLETVAEVGQTGVDFISSGSLTHSVKAADISLNLREEP